MWFRNSGGFVGSSGSFPVESSDTHAQHQHLEPAAMFTAQEQEDDVRASIPNSAGVKSPYEDEDDDEDRADERTQSSVQHRQRTPMESMDYRNDMMTSLNDDHVTSLFFDPSVSAPDPTLDFEWLFDNLSAELNSAASGYMPSTMSPGSSMSGTGISPPSFTVPSPAYIRSPAPSQSSGNSPWVGVRSNLLTALNSLAPEILMSSFFYPTNLSHFWDLYFENYHPHFPIVHKPTLDPVKAAPLLVAAIVTLGSTLSKDVGHFEMSVKIHDSVRYIIFNVRTLWMTESDMLSHC
jgi:hypothetical protein